MSDTLFGIIIGSILGIILQVTYYLLIEKGKLKIEREFSFLKEIHFILKKKFEEITKIIIEIDVYLLNKDIKHKSFSDIIDKISLIESLIGVYFPSIKDTYYVPYLHSISNYIDSTDINLKMEIGEKKEKLIEAIGKHITKNENSIV